MSKAETQKYVDELRSKIECLKKENHDIKSECEILCSQIVELQEENRECCRTISEKSARITKLGNTIDILLEKLLSYEKER